MSVLFKKAFASEFIPKIPLNVSMQTPAGKTFKANDDKDLQYLFVGTKFGTFIMVGSVHDQDFKVTPVCSKDLMEKYGIPDSFMSDQDIAKMLDVGGLIIKEMPVETIVVKTDWAKYLKYEDLEILRKEIIEQLVNSDKSFLEIKKPYL